MKKLLFIGLLFLGLNSFADEFTFKDLSGGMVSFPTSNTIPDNSASYIQNFYTDTYHMAEERKGYEKMSTTAIGNPSLVSGLWKFSDPDGSEWLVSFSSRSFYKNTSGNAPTKFGQTQSVDTIPDCDTNLGRLWCSDGTDDVWWFDGTSTGAVASAPKGRILEAWRTRIVIADVASARSSIYFSVEGDGTDWTIGDLEVDAFIKQIGGANDGLPVVGLKNYLDNLVAFRKSDIWSMQGFDQTDLNVRNMSKEVGCIDVRTIQELDGSILFLSNRGMEKLTGWTIENISEPIRNLTDDLVKNTANERSITQTSQSDWAEGTSVEYSELTVFPDAFTVLRDGSGGTDNVWTKYESGTITGTIDATGGYLTFTNAGGQLGRENIYTTDILPDFSDGTNYSFVINSMTEDSGNFSRLYMTLRPDVLVSGNPDSSGWAAVIPFYSTTTSKVFVSGLGIDGRSGPSYNYTNYDLPATVNFYLSSTQYILTINGSVALSGTHSATTGEQYLYFGYLKGSAGEGVCEVDNVDVDPQRTVPVSNTTSIYATPGSVTLSTQSAMSFVDTSSTDFSAGTLSNTSALVSIGNLTLSTFATVVSNITQEYDNSSFNNYIFIPSQSFTSPSTYSYLTTVEFNVFASNNCSPVVYLKSNNSGVPGSILKTGTALSNATGWQSSTLNYQLVPDTLYWLSINSCGSASDSYNQTYYASNENPYSGGSLIDRFGNSGWDAHFRINLDSVSLYHPTGTFLSQTFDMGTTTNTWLWNWDNLTSTQTLNGGSVSYETQTSSDAAGWETLQNVSIGYAPTSTVQRYIRYKASLTSSSDQLSSPVISEIAINSSPLIHRTGVFTSGPFLIGSFITSWEPIFFDDDLNGGTISYSFNSSSWTTFSDGGWTSITNGVTPTNSTNTYAQVRSTFTVTLATQNPTLNAITVSWSEGSTPPRASTVYDRRYWLSFTTNTAGGTYDDTILLYQRNKSWTTLKGINANSFSIFRDKLYFGDSTGIGYIYLFDTGNNDDQSPIVSELRTKSYDMGIPHKEKEFNRLYLNLSGDSSYTGSASMYYDTDRSGNEYSLGSVNLNEGTGNLLTKFHFPASNVIQGRELQYILKKSGTGDRLKLDGFITELTIKEPK